MSDYFGALLRSSGMAVGARAPAVVPAQAASGPMEIDVESASPPVQPQAARPAGAPQLGTEPLIEAARPASQAAGTPPVPVPADAALRGTPSVEAQRDGAPDVHALTETETNAVHTSTPTPAAERSAVATEPPLGEILVRAAMRWVAADPQPPARAPRAASRHDPPLESSAQSAGTVVSVASDGAAIELEAPSARTALARTSAREPGEARTAPLRSAGPAVPVPDAGMPAVRDELVDISIGSIHVRVDAPAAQTVARTPLPTPAAATRSTPAPARSGLSRRALRRI